MYLSLEGGGGYHDADSAYANIHINVLGFRHIRNYWRADFASLSHGRDYCFTTYPGGFFYG